MFDESLAVFGACFVFVAGVVYALAVWRRTVVPNRVTWLLWTAIPSIIFAASISSRAGPQSLFSLAAGLGPAIVVLTMWLRKSSSYWKISRLDAFCVALSILAIALWTATRNGGYAISFSLVADLAAATPTLRKAYRNPSSESASSFLLFLTGAILVLSSIDHWSLATAAFPLYAAVLYFSLWVLTVTPRTFRSRELNGPNLRDIP